MQGKVEAILPGVGIVHRIALLPEMDIHGGTERLIALYHPASGPWTKGNCW